MSKNLTIFLSLNLLLLSAILFSGCATQKGLKENSFIEEWKTKADSSQPYLPARSKFEDSSPGKKTQKSLTSATAEISQADKMQQIADSLPKTRVTVRFINDDLPTSLRSLCRLANQNILISPSISGTLNIHIRDTPWNKVFMGIINSYGLMLSKDDNLLQILSIDDLKKQVERKSLQLEKAQVSPLTTQIVPIEFSDPTTIVTSVNLLLSKNTEGTVRGSVSVDPHSRSLIIRDTEENMNNLLKLIYDLDSPTPQILIGAQIVETTSDTARELGIQWGAMSASNVLGDPDVTVYAGANGLPTTNGSLATPSFSNNVSLPATGPSSANGSVATIGLMAIGGDTLLNAQLSALQTDGKLNILSSPSIATLDNSEAIIESGKDVPYRSFDESGNNIITYRPATLKLTVTPHVISETMIRLDIEAKKDEVGTTGVYGETILKKLAKTQLIVKNGATVVIAGLSKEKHTDRDSGVPYLKDIPYLGKLFRHDANSKDFEELLIFITPTILTQAAGVNN